MSIAEKNKSSTVEKDSFTEIRFVDVWFRYPGTDRDILKGVNCTFKKDSLIAIVGENGCGKSTMIKLLLGLYPVTSGGILIDGINITEISDSSRQKLFSSVFQDYGVYKMTVRENIGIGRVENMNDDHKLIDAAVCATADELVSISDLDQVLGKDFDNGRELSSGQWQKIAIARAFFSSAALLVLDEPTAAIDPISEAGLYETVLKNSAEKACIVISHRMGSARFADKIYVLSDGVIAESGSHDELVSLPNGRYTRMFASQAKWYAKESSSDNEEETV